MKSLLKKLAIKHLGLQEVATSDISDECITIRVGECVMSCNESGKNDAEALSLASVVVNNANVDDINNNLESSSLHVYKQIAKARPVALDSKLKATTEKVTIVIQYETKFNDAGKVLDKDVEITNKAQYQPNPKPFIVLDKDKVAKTANKVASK